MGLTKTSLLFGTFATLVSMTSGLCPGETPCSGHGTCGSWDTCACHIGWNKEADCSARTCPHGEAWADTSSKFHKYLECSGKGACDREAGICECLEGFEGHACQRMKCPDNCSGHGVCKTLGLLDSTYEAWDAEKIQVCVCDPGWNGDACTKRNCILGDDPLTLNIVNTNTAQVAEVQYLTLGSSVGGGLTGAFTVTYTDWRGQEWTTYPIDLSTTMSAVTLEEALEALPNNVIDSVDVTMTGTAATHDLAYQVTFSSDLTPGDQTMLRINSIGCTISGCQPNYDGVTSLEAGYPMVTENIKGSKESNECSGRGKCNNENGLCDCFAGFAGQTCQTQTVIT